MEDFPKVGKRKRREQEGEEVEQEELSLQLNELLAHLTLIDWTSRDVLQNPEAVGAVKELVRNCDPEVLHWLLNEIKERLYRDARLWSLKATTTGLIRLGNEVYRRRKRH